MQERRHAEQFSIDLQTAMDIHDGEIEFRELPVTVENDRAVAIRVLFLVCAIMAAFIVWLYLSLWAPAHEMIRTAKGQVGHSEAEVISKLGPPDHIVTVQDLHEGKPVDHPWAGMNYEPVPTRPVTNKVLLYSEFNLAVYVYIDHRGNVEAVFDAGT